MVCSYPNFCFTWMHSTFCDIHSSLYGCAKTLILIPWCITWLHVIMETIDLWHKWFHGWYYILLFLYINIFLSTFSNSVGKWLLPFHSAVSAWTKIEWDPCAPGWSLCPDVWYIIVTTVASHANFLPCTSPLLVTCNSCETFIGVHDMHGRMHPN